MKEIKQAKIDEIAGKHKCQHDGYEYYKKEFVSREEANQCVISIYEIPPGKSAYLLPNIWRLQYEQKQ